MDTRQVIEDSRARWDRVREVIRFLSKHLDVTADELAEATGLSRATVYSRLAGTSELKVWEADGFAVALGVPREIFDLPPRQALRKALDYVEEDPVRRQSMAASRSRAPSSVRSAAKAAYSRRPRRAHASAA